jgi:methionyl-tRNA formyltransferase
MNLVFVGASKFGLRCLELANRTADVQIVGVITAPRVFSISYRPDGVTNVLHADVEACAQGHGIPVETLRTSMSDPVLFETVRGWNPEGLLVAGWYHMVPKSWRTLAPAYGLHASLLPDYSGGAPLVWAMINGEKRTGITLFQMDDGVDSGPIVAQAIEPILPDDTIASLYSRIEERGLELLSVALPSLAIGSLKLRLQDENRRRVFPQRKPDDGVIDWCQDAAVIDRFVRAQTKPYPGAFTTHLGRRFHIWATKPVNGQSSAAPGTVHKTADGYVVACKTGCILLEDTSYEQHDLTGSQLAALFEGGGQQLGAS